MTRPNRFWLPEHCHNHHRQFATIGITQALIVYTSGGLCDFDRRRLQELH